MKSMLLVGDPHACVGYNNLRFSALGRYIRETRPDIVLCTGDGNDMPSCSRYDRGKLAFEGRRVEKDLAHGAEAFDRVNHELRGMRRKPRKVMLLGNHERRLFELMSDHPELEGQWTARDFGYEDLGWEVVPFREVVRVEGFSCCHYMEQVNSKSEIGGLNVARSLLQKGHESTIVGHCHLFSLAEEYTFSGRRINAISPGCFTHGRFVEDWSKQSAKRHWRGVVRLDGVADGDYWSLTQVSLAQLMREYGGKK